MRKQQIVTLKAELINIDSVSWMEYIRSIMRYVAGKWPILVKCTMHELNIQLIIWSNNQIIKKLILPLQNYSGLHKFGVSNSSFLHQLLK